MDNTIQQHQADYKANAYENYTMFELGSFVHVLSKRAAHRTDPAKAAKDLEDARNYLAMAEMKLDALKKEILG